MSIEITETELPNEEELADELNAAIAKYRYADTSKVSQEDKFIVENYITACTIAHNACLSNRADKMKQSLFFLDKVIQ